MVIPRAVVHAVAGWALLLGGLWIEGMLRVALTGSMPAPAVAATVGLAPILFGLLLGVGATRGVDRSTAWLETLLALCFLAIPYAEAWALFSASGWWQSAFTDSTARGLAAVWLAVAVAQGVHVRRTAPAAAGSAAAVSPTAGPAGSGAGAAPEAGRSGAA